MNEKLLREFTEYCRANPSLRFWQALSNWSGESVLFWKTSDTNSTDVRDTYYFENKKKLIIWTTYKSLSSDSSSGSLSFIQCCGSAELINMATYTLKYKTSSDKDFKNLATYSDESIAREAFRDIIPSPSLSVITGKIPLIVSDDEFSIMEIVNGRRELTKTYRLIKNN